jgi:hypothetical protein
MWPKGSMVAVKRRVTTVEVSSSTMTAGPGMRAPEPKQSIDDPQVVSGALRVAGDELD